jgi:hypothetical protein
MYSQLYSLGFVVLIFAGMGAYYFFFYKKVAAAGGWGAMAAQAQQAEFQLFPGEALPRGWYVGETYFGPLTNSDLSTGQQVMGVLTGTEYRGYMLHLAMTSTGRLVMTKEPEGEGRQMGITNMSMDQGYRPFMVFRPEQARPQLLSPQQAFPNHPALGHAFQGPQRNAMNGQLVKLDLGTLVFPDGRRYSFWCEPAGLQHLFAWCNGQA